MVDKGEDTYLVACDERPREYDDGPGWPRENPAKERAFRRAFVEEARRIVRDWTAPPETNTSDPFGETETAAKLRVRARERFAVYERGDAGPKTYHRGYRPGHEVPAARMRGSHHAMVYVTEPSQCPGWPDLDIFDPQLLQPWLVAVESWAVEPVPFDRIVPPPRPFDALRAEHAASERPTMMDAPAPQSPPLAQPGAPLTAPVIQPASIDIQTFAETPEREIVWLWQGVIPRGMLSLIGGKQGLGKSFLVCDIAARVSTGRPMPAGVANAPGNVLLLAREDDASSVLLPRLKAAKADLRRVWWSLFANADTTAPLDLTAHVGMLARTVVEKSIDLVVVDTFASFAPVGTDSNAARDVRLLLDALTRLSRATGAAVVVVAHLRKSGQGDGDPMDAIAGSHQMTAGVRVASMLDKGAADGERWFRVVKSNLGRIDERGWTWRFAWPDPFTEGAAEMPHIEWAVAGDEYEGMAQGRTPAGCDPQAVRFALADLLADGPRSRRNTCGLVAAVLRKTQPHVRIDDVALVVEELVHDGDDGVETWDGPRGAKMIGLPGSRPESAEDKALRLARENPDLSVRELRALAGCRRDVAMLALREAREASGRDAP